MIVSPQRLIILLAVGMVVLAGCGANGTQTPTTSESPAPTATSSVSTTVPSTETTDQQSPTATSVSTVTETQTPSYRDVSVAASTVKRDAMAAMGQVTTYRVQFENERTITTNRISQTISIDSTGAFDRSVQTLHVNQTVSGPAGTVSIQTYVDNRTLYEQSEEYVRQYDSQWIKIDISQNFSSKWELLDTLTRQRTILNQSDVEVLGATDLDGTETYVLQVDINETAYTELIKARIDSTSEITVTDATFTYWINTETSRLVQSAGSINSTAVVNGESLNIHEEITFRFQDYGEPVEITLPSAASTAVSIDNSTSADN